MNENIGSKGQSENTSYISVVLPALDEELTIAGCIEEIKETFEKNNISAEIIVSSSSIEGRDEIDKSPSAKRILPENEDCGNECFGDL